MSAERPVPPDLYDRRYYLESCGGSEFFKAYGAEVLKPQLQYCLSRAALLPGMGVLDLGCGRGELLYHVRRSGARGVGTDYAPEALAIAGRVSGCPVLRCDAKALPFAPASFDRVFLVGVLDHLHPWELERCFSELGRVLRPGGRVLAHTCANRLYYKNWSYAARRAAARGLRRLGLDLREPEPPRSEEDGRLHVNESSLGDLRRFFRRIGWEARAEPRPNYKLVLRELYGELPEGFPMAPAPRWRSALYRGLLFRWPLAELLARELFVIAWPR